MASFIANELKRLRESVQPHLSRKKMAELLGMPEPTYRDKEARHKKDYFPPEFACQVVEILVSLGVPREDCKVLLRYGSDMQANVKDVASEIRRVHERLAAIERLLKAGDKH